MLKDFRVLWQTSNIIRDTSEDAVSELLAIHPDIIGREEEFTSQLKSEITLHLMDRISKKLGGKNIHGIRFDVYTFKKRKENKVSADLLGLLEIEIGGKRITKAYLAQAKVGITYQDSENGEVYAKCYDSLLQKKCQICLI